MTENHQSDPGIPLSNYRLADAPVLRWDEKKVNGKERCSVVLDGDDRSPMHIGEFHKQVDNLR
jgi:hypothetical protein